jgi:hypothetical protein
LELEKIEVDVEDGQDVISAVKAVIASRWKNKGEMKWQVHKLMIQF